MPVLTCTRCQQTKESLSEPPVGGQLGQAIIERICADCWEEWRETSARLINHYGLNSFIPDHRAELRRVMKEFLSIQD